MAIKTVYISKLGKEYKISDHFKLKEFQCKDGSDIVVYNTELLSMLEKLRAYGGFTIHINSGYRTAAYNKKIGGAITSQHIKGAAADIVVYKNGDVIHAKKVCCLAQTLGFKGIGYMSDRAVHVDMRTFGSYRGDERKGYGNNVSDFYKYFNMTRETIKNMKVPEAKKKEEVMENNGGGDMNKEEAAKILEAAREEKMDNDCSDYSAAARKWAIEKGIIKGVGTLPDGSTNYAWEDFLTREQFVTMLYRFSVMK